MGAEAVDLERSTMSFHCGKQIALSTSIVIGMLLLATGVPAADDAVTDLAQAGSDFAVQGEYRGQWDAGEGLRDAGAQVITLGHGTFQLVLYAGGLPGDGWKRGDRLQRADGRTEGDQTKFSAPTWSAVAADGKLTVSGADGSPRGQLTRLERRSPTLGAAPPPGAMVLFDGTSADAFPGAQLTADGLLLAGCESKARFGDHTLHLEFRTPLKSTARGQARGNSGVYLQSRYEIQILDSFGLEGQNNECGGIYAVAAPLVNMCLPPLAWQTYDIDFKAARYDQRGQKVTNARVTVRHNGVLIHDDLELPGATPGKRGEGPQGDALYLQGHGNPVVFRNIWVVAK
jgi:hypothetical protein